MPKNNFENIDPKQFIIIKGANVNNLKNLSVVIPRNKFIVITGVSGSGKSSLAFDTLYAEGQRRYVESLSSYARQFLGKMHKPQVEYIKGISPAIAIEQRVNTKNPRSTVGTSTEIYEYLKLLFARIGKTYSPVSGKLVKANSISDVVDEIMREKEGSKIILSCPLHPQNGRNLIEELQILLQKGFSRIMIADKIIKIDEVLKEKKLNKKSVQIVIDRFVVNKNDEDLKIRVADSVQTAFYEGRWICVVNNFTSNKKKKYSNKFELDGIVFEKPSVNFFTFNNPFGACKKCEGFGNVIGIDPCLVIPDRKLSVFQGAVACWKGEKMKEWKQRLVMNAYHFKFPIHKPINKLTAKQEQLLWNGNKYFGGINDFFKNVEAQTYKIQYRVMLSRYRGRTLCTECNGTRLRKDASFVKVNGLSINELVLLPVKKLLSFFKMIELEKRDKIIAKRLLIEINNRLRYLNDVGLGYLTLNRLSSTLSGGESQRINLSISLGSSLVGSMYILDEPSIGLHSVDTQRLIKILYQLRDIGNTVIVIEHDEEIIKAANEIIDIGPEAGRLGGELVFQGNHRKLKKEKNSLTAKYMNGILAIPVPKKRRKWKEYIEIIGANENNLKSIDVKIPLHALTVVTGPSGSGKTTLVKDIFYNAIKRKIDGYGQKAGLFNELLGDVHSVAQIEMVDQNPIGTSSRSNAVTYIKAYDDIRVLYASQKLAEARKYRPGYFSFNVPGGRCEECKGDGKVKIEMQFMADIYLICDNCNGKRFSEEVLDIKYKGKTIVDLLEMSISDAIKFFEDNESESNLLKRIITKLKPLKDVGLGYIKMGQASSTLSGGEAQRVKLASFLTKGYSASKVLFIFDEPTTGLHFHDISKLLDSFNALIERGHTIVVIEHNMDVIKNADWIIDLGPEGGEQGGKLIFEGTPESMIEKSSSYTAKFLKDKLISS